MGEKSKGEKYMGDKSVGEKYVGEKPMEETRWVKSLRVKNRKVKSLWLKSLWVLWVKSVGERFMVEQSAAGTFHCFQSLEMLHPQRHSSVRFVDCRSRCLNPMDGSIHASRVFGGWCASNKAIVFCNVTGSLQRP